MPALQRTVHARHIFKQLHLQVNHLIRAQIVAIAHNLLGLGIGVALGEWQHTISRRPHLAYIAPREPLGHRIHRK